MATIEEVGNKIRASIGHARSKGYRIIPNVMVGKNCCCAIGSLVVDLYETEPFAFRLYTSSGERLGLNMHELTSVARGFDGKQDRYDKKEWADLGVQLRREVDSGSL